MLPYTISGKAEFKKEYNFLWKLEPNTQWNSDDVISEKDRAPSIQIFKKITQEDRAARAAAGNPFSNENKYTLDPSIGFKYNQIFDKKMIDYVCQLCESVDVPDDEIETEDISVGPAVYKMPVRVLMSDITVTYLEDSLNSVYNFHKAWFSLLRKDGLQSPFQYCAKGTYVTFDNTMDMAEFTMFRNIISNEINTMTSYVRNVSNDYFGTALGLLNDYANTTFKLKGSTIYNQIYPTKISRGTANKGGTGLSKVTVTYVRLPTFDLKNNREKAANALKNAVSSAKESQELL